MSGNYVVRYILIFNYEFMERRFDTFAQAERFALDMSEDPCCDCFAKIFREDKPELLPAVYKNGKRKSEVTE